MSDTSTRRLQVLRAIVEDYVQTREPVGSKALVERRSLEVSPATIRNDMAQLEEEGLIVAPHTSAGRIPTDRGYRLFVDRITEVRPLSRAERRAMDILAETADDPDATMEQTVRLLAMLTNQVAVIQHPQHTSATIRHVDVVPMSAQKALVIVILSTGKVEQRMVTLAETPDEDALHRIGLKASEQLYGRSASAVPIEVKTLISVVEPALQPTMAVVAHAVETILESGRVDRIIMAGTANLAKSGGDLGPSIGPILEALEEQVVLLRLLHEMQHDRRGLSVRIGQETSHESLQDTAVVAAEYATGKSGGDGAKLGVVGPTRMDYGSTMSAVRAMARYLSRILSEG
ncbi:heat-inducible transcriptional repressor HrcA [Nesterenkonia natronophila]|uniref:Heat-inducible transcription repressor HrcA n=1 Tax=Nesterenkonia natronophila TaxID=2174932 RepID=A0A3A4F892_9MICC|nr:heat-inducible transcriptional repressor HrcA [Nesterenkonia natronophila]RJN31104.1 heat-inducible transcriptional repressor HrcA [Nesterenkonia natronophila]